MRVELGGGAQRCVVGFEDAHSPGCTLVGYGVDKNQGVPVLEQDVCQVHAPDPVIDGAHLLGGGEPRGDMTQHLGAEAVITEEDVADAGNQDAGRDVSPIGLFYIRRMRR